MVCGNYRRWCSWNKQYIYFNNIIEQPNGQCCHDIERNMSSYGKCNFQCNYEHCECYCCSFSGNRKFGCGQYHLFRNKRHLYCNANEWRCRANLPMVVEWSECWNRWNDVHNNNFDEWRFGDCGNDCQQCVSDSSYGQFKWNHNNSESFFNTFSSHCKFRC